jgi:hypothetical protein
MDAATIVHHDDEALRLVSTGGLMLVHIRQRFTHAESVAIHAGHEYLRSSVGRHAVFVIIGDARTELSERARNFSRRTTAEFANWVVCVANVIEPRGVMGATVRCVLAGLRAINKPPYPTREFASTRGAALWMVPIMAAAGIELPIELDPGGLLEWVDRARAHELLDTGQTSLGT